MEIDKVYYYNRNGVLKLTLNEHPYFCDDAVFKDWTWEYNEQFGRFLGFYRAKKEYPFTVTITTDDLDARDALCDIFSDDVLAESPGYLMIRGWKLPCYIVEAEHDFFGTCLDHQIAFNVISESSTWVREKTKYYSGKAEGGASSDVDLGRDYSYDDNVLGRGYNYGYSEVVTHFAAINLAGSDNGFRVTFYGAVTDPVIYINNQPVKVNISLDSDERLILTSNGSEKTIKVVTASGYESDAFIYRDKNNSPFLSLDKYTELTYGDVAFEFTTIEKRSEPAWN